MNLSIRHWLYIFLAGAAALLSGFARADPPSSIARLSYVSGAVSFSPAGESDWVSASTNRPLIASDRIWVPAGSRAELQTSGATVRIAGGSSLDLLNIADRISQLELTRGTIVIRVRREDPNRVIEVDTPNLAVTMRRVGTYRVTVDPNDDATTVIVREGEAEVFGAGAAYVIRSQESYQFFGLGLRDFDALGAIGFDEFDRWGRDRDRRFDASISARYVSSDVLGYQDLDTYGTWRTVSTYGPVWFPTQVSRTWAPYTDGHWSWIEPWGWTWVDAATWGFAVSHYGRWAYLNNTWGWVPGPARERAVYAPALVAFVDVRGARLSGSFGGDAAVAWFPLAPREVYRPAYTASRDYLVRLNRSNTTINDTVIVNSFNTNITNITYVNQGVPGAIVAVPNRAFTEASPISRVAMRIDSQQAMRAPVEQVAMVAPVQRSVFGGAQAGARPPLPQQGVERPVVVRTAPPAAPPDFSLRQQALNAAQGRPLSPEETMRLRPQGANNSVPQPQRTMVAPPTAPARPMATVQPTPSTPEVGAGGGFRGRAEPAAVPGLRERPQMPGQPASTMAPPGFGTNPQQAPATPQAVDRSGAGGRPGLEPRAPQPQQSSPGLTGGRPPQAAPVAQPAAPVPPQPMSAPQPAPVQRPGIAPQAAPAPQTAPAQPVVPAQSTPAPQPTPMLRPAPVTQPAPAPQVAPQQPPPAPQPTPMLRPAPVTQPAPTPQPPAAPQPTPMLRPAPVSQPAPMPQPPTPVAQPVPFQPTSQAQPPRPPAAAVPAPIAPVPAEPNVPPGQRGRPGMPQGTAPPSPGAGAARPAELRPGPAVAPAPPQSAPIAAPLPSQPPTEERRAGPERPRGRDQRSPEEQKRDDEEKARGRP